MNEIFYESYKTKVVEQIFISTYNDRYKWLSDNKYNIMKLKSSQIIIDLLTDSGTGAMSNNQWAGIMKGDESYAGSSSFDNLQNKIKKIFDFDYILPTHQGRGAENVLFSSIIKEGDIIPGNSHFDTTKAHIEYRKASGIECIINESYDINNEHPFKGNIDLNKLNEIINNNKDKIPMIIITITCNSYGGQPVSLDNIKSVYNIAKKNNILVCIDSARFAENAYFIKNKEEQYKHMSIKQISKEIYKYSDIMIMSSKKDAIVNIGGFIAFKNYEHWKKASTYNILFEGYISYGGLAGRDMEALAIGLDEGTEYDYLHTRIQQVHYLGNKLKEYGIPVIKPFGGHGIFIDALKFLPNVPREQYPADILACLLYLESGIRVGAIGTILAGRDPITKLNRYPKLELLRLAIPRRVYSNNHMDLVALSLKNIYDKCDTINTGLKIINEDPLLRHFTIEFDTI